MDQADNCRRAAADAVGDVEPPQLHDRITTVIENASMLPGVLTIESAAAIAPETTNGLSPTLDHGHDACDAPPSESAVDAVLTHAAGVQLIYEGLRLTRSLAHDEPWTDPDEAADGDLAILAADILVARGFYLLARTDAAGKAVRTVQAFGRHQTRRQTADPVDQPSIDATLERDVLELAIIAGAAAVGNSPTTRLLTIADDLADTVDRSFPPAKDCLTGFDASIDHAADATDTATSVSDR